MSESVWQANADAFRSLAKAFRKAGDDEKADYYTRVAADHQNKADDLIERNRLSTLIDRQIVIGGYP